MMRARLAYVALVGGLAGCSDPAPEAPSPEAALIAAASRTQAKRGPEWPEAPADGAPVLVKFESLTEDGGQKRAKVRFYNFGDRDVHLLELKLEYVDSAGKVLKTFPWKATPSLQARTHASHVVGAFLPVSTELVRVQLTGVRYEDGGTWKPEGSAVQPAEP